MRFVVSENGLFAWEIDRDPRYARFDDAPYGDDGEELTLFNGVEIEKGATINLTMPRRGELADFLYAPSLLMYASERAWDVIREGNAPHVAPHPLVLRDRRGNAINDQYWWLNIKLAVPLMDKEHSLFTTTLYGGVKSVGKFVIARGHVPKDDLFLSKELAVPIFTECLKNAVESAGLTGAHFEALDSLQWP